MKRLMLIIILFASFCIALGDSKYPVDFENINKATTFLDESLKFETENKSIKSKKNEIEAEKILRNIFPEGLIVTSKDKCFFKKIKTGYMHGFAFSCKEETDTEWVLTFNFDFGTSGKIYFGKNLTSDSVAEIFEDSTLFKGKIKIISYGNDTYSFNKYNKTLEVYCKVISLTPIDATEKNLINEDESFTENMDN